MSTPKPVGGLAAKMALLGRMKPIALDVRGLEALLRKPAHTTGIFRVGADTAPAAPAPASAPAPAPIIAPESSGLSTAYAILSTVSMAASAYHGYKRNNSIGWALGWGLLGSMFPVITPVVALAQGYAKPAK